MTLFHTVCTWIALGYVMSIVLHVVGTGRGALAAVRTEVTAFLVCIAFGPVLALIGLMAKLGEKNNVDVG